MNKRIDLTNLGGFPLEQDTLKFMQDSYAAAFGAMAAHFGDKVIVSGVQVSGSNVSDGWISYQGELIPFIGGTLGAQVVITEEKQSVTFEDGVDREVYITKTATCGVSGAFPFADLKPAGLVPKGLISMWSGAINAIPAGWALCDGQSGRPDLRAKFIVGYHPDLADYNAIGKTGGEEKHTLLPAEMPKHTHKISRGDSYSGNSQQSAMRVGGGQGTTPQPDQDTGIAGGDQPHENRPPYYTLAYIIKL